MGNNLLYVCSPYRGEIRRNKEYARELTKVAINSGFAPVAVHLYLTEVLDDNKPQERNWGMAAGQEILKRCGYILLGEKYGISEGMKEEITLAALKGLTMLYEKDGKFKCSHVKKLKERRSGNGVLYKAADQKTK